jgi:hypothetical protein
MYWLSNISAKLKLNADLFHTKFQAEYTKRTQILNRNLSSTEILIMKSSLHKEHCKGLDFEQIVVDCTIAALEQLNFASLPLDDAELLFSFMKRVQFGI